MTIISIKKEARTGFFCYELENDLGEIMEDEVGWEIKIEMDKGFFASTRVDSETKDLFAHPVKVEGFKEGDEISLVVRYPCNYGLDEYSGKYIAYRNEYHPGAKYFDTWDSSEQKYKGRCTIEFFEEKLMNFGHDTRCILSKAIGK